MNPTIASTPTNAASDGGETILAPSSPTPTTAVDELEQTANVDEAEENEIPPDVEVIQTEPPQQKKKKKAKFQDVPEDDSVDEDFAVQLDVSCVSESPIAAPAIDDAFVLKYAR